MDRIYTESTEETVRLVRTLIENVPYTTMVLYPSPPLIEAVLYNEGYGEYTLPDGKKDFLNKKQRRKAERLLKVSDYSAAPGEYIFPSEAFEYVGNLIYLNEIAYPSCNKEECNFGWDIRAYKDGLVTSAFQDFVSSVNFNGEYQ